MKKKFTVVAAVVMCVICVAIGATCATVVQTIQAEIRPDFSVVIDGQETVFKNAQGDVVYPMFYNGTTYLPIRAIGEMMGKTVYWYEEDKRIELKSETSTVTDADVIITSGGGAGRTAITTSGSEITLDEAKAIALDKAGLDESVVTFTKAKLETDDGVREYDIEFWKDNVEYSAEIRASDGAVLSWDIDMERTLSDTSASVEQTGDIGLEKAKEIALAKAGFDASEVVFTETSLEYDDGRRVYEIEFVKDYVEYSAEILASDGTLVSWDIDRD
ncbi:MAG: PepSY domain-containing protein [Clostridia bacterium]|nr:PepSY domain-containing protein [Clostridia bacterium]